VLACKERLSVQKAISVPSTGGRTIVVVVMNLIVVDLKGNFLHSLPTAARSSIHSIPLVLCRILRENLQDVKFPLPGYELR
jgi:hypothetical protein